MENFHSIEMMSWIQFGIFVIGVFGLFIWNRSESRADIRNVETKLESNRQLTLELLRESKDFHARLYALEQKYINWKMEQK
jgi:hypothetical protein